jgi:hypothetical protein
MTRADLSVAGAYCFFVAILLQGPVALVFISTGLDIPVSPFYAVKLLPLAAAVWLMLATRTLPRSGRTENIAIAIVLLIALLAVAKGTALYNVGDQLKFYMVPFVLFFVGRGLAPFRSERQLGLFLMVVAGLYVFFGISYELIGREALSDIGLKTLLSQKFSDVGRGSDEFVYGYPTNFWLFLNGGGIQIPRAFGALFDPLATAFFGMPLCFYLWEAHRRKAIAGAGLMAVAVALSISLTLTRSIIIGIALVSLASRLFKKGVATVPLWPAAVLFIAVAIGMAMNSHAAILLVESSLDPSSIAHFEAYLKWDASTSLLGHRFAYDAPRGEESLYLTIFFESGIAGLICFLTWFGHLYFRLRKSVDDPYARAAFESFVVYFVASFTTEHWFASTSGSLFWFLLGNTFTFAEERRVVVDRECRSAAGTLADTADGGIVIS